MESRLSKRKDSNSQLRKSRQSRRGGATQISHHSSVSARSSQFNFTMIKVNPGPHSAIRQNLGLKRNDKAILKKL